MSIPHPQTLIQALGDLDDELRRWITEASETLSDAQRVQRHAQESLERVEYRTSIVRDQAEHDEGDVADKTAEVNALIAKCQEAVRNAQETLKQCKSSQKEAETVLMHWKAELQKALEWLARAQARLERAIRAYNAAVNAYNAAVREVDSAISSYNRCARDPERRNCNSERNRVERAKNDLLRAKAELDEAEVELQAAKAEVERAQARVNCCTTAVMHATTATTYAAEGVKRAGEALTSAERSLEYGQAAGRAIKEAETHLQNELNEVEQMTLAVRSGRQLTESAFLRLKSAERSEESAHRYAVDVGYELQYRVARLTAFNRSEAILDNYGTAGFSSSFSGGSSSASSGSISADFAPVLSAWLQALANLGGGHGARYQKARQQFLRGLVNDENQPSYVRGWIRQEINRLERIQQAKETGSRSPGGNQRQIKGVPGLDVGHIYPDIDLPENFRLESADMNRARPGISRRLGLFEKIR